MADPVIAEIADLLHGAARTLFITGAGLSADSGMPVYRGVGGLYNDTNTEDGLPIEVALSGVQFSRDPAVTWKYLFQIERACRDVQPNAGHRVIADLERIRPGTWTLTQNVDGLHLRAGSANLVEIHGRFSDLYCSACGHRETVADYRHLASLPQCPRCNGPLRPAVVLFGEMLPEAALAVLDREMSRGFDLVFSVGTSSLFPYITAPVLEACRLGIPTVEINPGETDVSGLCTYRLRMGAAAALAAIWQAYQLRQP